MDKKQTVLLVDDDAALRRALSDALASEGIAVFQAANGIEGLAVAMREHPEIILLDLLMPVMGGLDMLTELRKDKWGEKAFVTLLTNSSEYHNVAGAVELGVKDYLIKSDWDILDLVRKVQEKIEELKEKSTWHLTE